MPLSSKSLRYSTLRSLEIPLHFKNLSSPLFIVIIQEIWARFSSLGLNPMKALDSSAAGKWVIPAHPIVITFSLNL